MEENKAILIADLSGYTALTETHGAITAADLIDKYLELVNDALVGDSKLHQRVGDEVMIVSSSPDHLINTAIMLIQNCCKQHKFLQLHGGLHYGRILNRNDHYFGSALNLASRIAGKANKGTFWCSEEFVTALSNRTEFTFSSKGKHSFKNVSDENEMFELIIEHPYFYHVDPVCRMLIHKNENAIPHPHKENVFFCSFHCLDIYTNNEVVLNGGD